MSWKDYFYFTASQRRALIFLISLVLILFIINSSYSYFENKNKAIEVKDTAFLAEVIRFKSSLKETKTNYNYNSAYPNRYNYYPKNWIEKVSAVLFPFNPNTLDSVGFVKLGLKPFMARNILRYRAKGGKFRSVEAFSKVYGLSDEQFATLKPYIQIPPEEKPVYAKKEQPAVMVELNAADTSQLKLLHGIGSVIAKRIVAYRNKLGGFASANQIKEVWGISPELAQQIMPFITADASQLKKIPINKSSIDRLRNHPYMNFYRAKAIYEYRKDKGKIKSIQECKSIDDESLTPEFWTKMEPYLEF